MTPERLPDGLPPIDLATLDLLPDPAWVTPAEPGSAYFNAAWLALTGAPACSGSTEELPPVRPSRRARPAATRVGGRSCDVRAEHLAGYGTYLAVTLARG
ncbi:MAG: hypothetical protein M3N49_02920 [Candidatus Eremiobacteraeota bacterium]|nr:hypothetical protein [Candidatus Eremiobacteraeota bacterium]